jgi:hypothetical protein
MATIPNVPPNANAGPDITVHLSETATLDGSASNDPDNGPQPLSYGWSFVTVPTESQLTNNDITGADTVSPSFAPDASGTYVIQLMVSDGPDFDYDNVAVTVLGPARRMVLLSALIPVKLNTRSSLYNQQLMLQGQAGKSLSAR